MNKRELRRLSRADLLEMLIDQSKEVQELRQRLSEAEAALQNRELIIEDAGSIAEASLALNGVFEAAQNACDQYIENIRRLGERQEAFYLQRERENMAWATSRLDEARRRNAYAQTEMTGDRLPKRRRARQNPAYMDPEYPRG